LPTTDYRLPTTDSRLGRESAAARHENGSRDLLADVRHHCRERRHAALSIGQGRGHCSLAWSDRDRIERPGRPTTTPDDYDALFFSGNSGAATPAKAGYPSIVVPSGFFVNDPTMLIPP